MKRMVIAAAFALSLAGCVSPIVMQNPQTGEITQCLATGAFPLINQQQCVASHENLGWVRTTAAEAQQAARQQSAERAAQIASEEAQCASDMQSAELDPIRHKVELLRQSPDTPPPFEIASNDTFPAADERPIIAKWATVREGCLKRVAALPPPPSATALQVTFRQQDRAFMQEANGRVSSLIVALYQAKLTYGEFAQRRYEITRDAAAAERQFRAAALIADRERQIQAQQLAQQQFQNNLIAWSTYMQAVNARQPQTVHLTGTVGISTHCLSQHLGQMVSTDCR
jgi:hypothetical protein